MKRKVKVTYPLCGVDELEVVSLPAHLETSWKRKNILYVLYLT